MTEQLPITIKINDALIERFIKIKSVCNKLEAQFNFHTLMANWYGDEENTLLIELILETPASFNHCKEKLEGSNISITSFSDDVICSVNEGEQQFLCYVSLTGSELELITLQPKLLSGFLQTKLHKVLNLIARKQLLSSI